jgi:DNA-binding MarR family transcriptional regulator
VAQLLVASNCVRVENMDCTDSLVTLQKAWQISTRQAHLPAVEQRLQAAAGLALTRPARTTLLQLSEGGPLHVSDLAAAAGVDVSTMSRTLRQLGASGFIAREQGEDQRAVRISLTSAGEEAVARLLAAGQIILRDVLSGWSENDRDALSRLMVRFADDFSTYLRQTSNQNREREVESWA